MLNHIFGPDLVLRTNLAITRQKLYVVLSHQAVLPCARIDHMDNAYLHVLTSYVSKEMLVI